MIRHSLSLAIGLAFANLAAAAGHASAIDGLSKAWTYQHANTTGFLSEIVSFDHLSKTLWVTGVSGVDVLNASTGALVQRIDLTPFGSINSVSIHNGIAAFAMESSVRTNPGQVLLYSTATRAPVAGINAITVGALPDMLTFTPDGKQLLVANEGTPSTYGPLTSAAGVFPRTYDPAAVDPVGSVSIIDMASRSVWATATLAGVPETGKNIRKNTGMDFEPEYITVGAGERVPS